MKKLYSAVLLIWAIPALAGEMVIDLERVFHDEITKKYGSNWASWIMSYPTHPIVDVSGAEPKIHDGLTSTWRTYDPKRAEWACVFRINADGEIVGRYLYDNRLKPRPVSEDSVLMLLKHDVEDSTRSKKK